MIEGKTKSIKPIGDGLVLITTKNVLTAFDAVKKEDLEVAKHKTLQTCNIFEYLEGEDIPTAFVRRDSDTTFVAKECEMLPYEVVVRAYAYGSYLKRNPKATKAEKLTSLELEHFHKHSVVHGDILLDEAIVRDRYLRDGEWAIPDIITDPYIRYNWSEWKDLGGDINSHQGLIQELYDPKKPILNENKLLITKSDITPATYHNMNSIAMSVFRTLSKAWDEFGVTLVDIKLEFGYDSKGKCILADVIDNDSWRVWDNGDYKQQLDKQSFRDGEDNDTVVNKYARVTELTSKFKDIQ